MQLSTLTVLLTFNIAYSRWHPYYTADRKLAGQDMCLPGNFSNRLIFLLKNSSYLNYSVIYCGSKLIEAVNYHSLYNDSKTFVGEFKSNFSY